MLFCRERLSSVLKFFSKDFPLGKVRINEESLTSVQVYECWVIKRYSANALIKLLVIDPGLETYQRSIICLADAGHVEWGKLVKPYLDRFAGHQLTSHHQK